jgi:Mn-dependent DtxR family transcriptional regulator
MYVMTASDVHKKIKEISLKYISKKPPISVDNLAVELGLNPEDLPALLKDLENLGLIHLNEQHLWITDSGLQASLP